ncbi:LOW QUALITY PROTEIN: hypothetical protein MXB_4504 [Myxobolus squamalis]|nr:LOW QUALITY PROTEIN: hypothetical protein MXB_4504 [Myxobolus squamalis]
MRACVSEPELNEERILKFAKPLPKGHELDLNVLHWGGDNRIAVGLGSSVYIWNANAGNINKIEPSNDQGPSEYVSSVRWSGCSTNSCLAIGYSSGVTKFTLSRVVI